MAVIYSCIMTLTEIIFLEKAGRYCPRDDNVQHWYTNFIAKKVICIFPEVVNFRTIQRVLSVIDYCNCWQIGGLLSLRRFILEITIPHYACRANAILKTPRAQLQPGWQNNCPQNLSRIHLRLHNLSCMLDHFYANISESFEWCQHRGH